MQKSCNISIDTEKAFNKHPFMIKKKKNSQHNWYEGNLAQHNKGHLLTDGSDSKESACNVGDPGLIPGLGRSSGEGNGNPLQYSYL